MLSGKFQTGFLLISMQNNFDGTFKSAMRRLASSVSVITCKSGNSWYGMTVSSVTSLCTEPPSVLVCVNRSASFYEPLRNSEKFCINVLGVHNLNVSMKFSQKLASHAEKFSEGKWFETPDGIPCLLDAQSNIVCRIATVFSYGTHDIFVGNCENIRIDLNVSPLLYVDGHYGAAALVHAAGC